jgi:YfiH family protein
VAEVLRFSLLDGLPVDALVTTRDGGVSSGAYESLNLGLHVADDPALVLENRRRAAALVGAELDDLVVCQQAHARDVFVAGDGDRGRGARSIDDGAAVADALVTAVPGPVLVTMVADCVPVVLYEPDAHVLGCVHAGWRGTVQRVLDAAIDEMVGLGARPERLLAGIGPAIGADVYQVGDEVREAALTGFGGEVDDVVQADPSTPGRWLFDLHTANRRTLLEAGVPAERIEVLPISTGRDERFFSDRAARPCGRFALLGRLLPRPT